MQNSRLKFIAAITNLPPMCGDLCVPLLERGSMVLLHQQTMRRTNGSNKKTSHTGGFFMPGLQKHSVLHINAFHTILKTGTTNAYHCRHASATHAVDLVAEG